jgi:hypothetical protein
MAKGLPLEPEHRQLYAMPVGVVFGIHDCRVALFLHVPTADRRVDGEPDDMAVHREFSIDNHGSLSKSSTVRKSVPREQQESYERKDRDDELDLRRDRGGMAALLLAPRLSSHGRYMGWVFLRDCAEFPWRVVPLHRRAKMSNHCFDLALSVHTHLCLRTRRDSHQRIAFARLEGVA